MKRADANRQDFHKPKPTQPAVPIVASSREIQLSLDRDELLDLMQDFETGNSPRRTLWREAKRRPADSTEGHMLNTSRSLRSGSSFRSRLSPASGTGDEPMISLRPSLIRDHHSVSSLNDLAREASTCSKDLHPAVMRTRHTRSEVTTHELMVTKARSASSREVTPRMRRSIRRMALA